MRDIPNRRCQGTMAFRDVLNSFMLDQQLGFSSLLDQDSIRDMFAKHRALFGGVFHTAIVLWAFLSQVLRDGKEASCRSAVARISAFLAHTGGDIPDPNTGDYCKARAKLSEAAIQALSQDVALRIESQADSKWKWRGHRTFLIDGFTFQMPDTRKNQKAYPQHTAQKPGIGFPIARVVAIVSLATGVVISAAIGRYKGKQTGELALFKQLFGHLQPGDIVVADRHYCSYWMICTLLKLGVQVCFRMHQTRHTDFRKGKRLGTKDHVVFWPRSVKPDWMSKNDYEALPKELRLREIGYVIEEPGRKQQPFVIVTTMLGETDTTDASKDEIASLYGFRWNVELDIRSIKSNMNLGFLRCKSPAMIHREFWVTILAYNLIRSTIALAASQHNRLPRQVSFTAACQFVLTTWNQLITSMSQQERLSYCEQLLRSIAHCKVANRPGRFEPRVVKRRRDQYTLMTQPRNDLRMRLARGDNAFE
jgi:putative transposase